MPRCRLQVHTLAAGNRNVPLILVFAAASMAAQSMCMQQLQAVFVFLLTGTHSSVGFIAGVGGLAQVCLPRAAPASGCRGGSSAAVGVPRQP